MRAITLAAALLLVGLAGAPLLALSAAAQAGVEPDAEPVAEAAEDLQADGGAQAAQAQARADGQQDAWGGYAASAAGSPGTAPAPTDESASTMAAAGEQGGSTVAFGSRSASTVAGGAAGASSNTMDQSSPPAPALPSDDANPGPDPDPDPVPPGEGDGGDGDSPPADDGSGAEPAAGPEDDDPVAADDAAPTEAATVPLPARAEEADPTAGDLDPAQPAPPVPDGRPDRALGDGTQPANQLASVAGPAAGPLVSAVATVTVLGLAVVATAATWLACRKPLT